MAYFAPPPQLFLFLFCFCLQTEFPSATYAVAAIIITQVPGGGTYMHDIVYDMKQRYKLYSR